MTVAKTINITLPNYGTIRGSVDTQRQVAIFRNVPYAHAPVRWRVAVKPQPWTGVRDATIQG
jgi:para-nitrobenzyl esterase